MLKSTAPQTISQTFAGNFRVFIAKKMLSALKNELISDA